MGRDTAADDPYDLGDKVPRYPAVPLLVPAAARRWRQVFSGEERQLGLMRRWLAACLPDCPTRDDVISVATELGSNAILHTASGRGGWFAVELTWDPSMVRIAVADHGSPAEPHMIEDPDGEHGRGLLLVNGLSARTGVTGNEQGRTVWAEIAWDGPTPDADLAAAGPGDVEIRDGEAALARRFAGVPVWFGRATRAWWALAGPRDLVTAPTASELAALLHQRLNTPPRPRSADTAGRRQEAVRRLEPDGPMWDPAAGARLGPDPRADYRPSGDRAGGLPRSGRSPGRPSDTWHRSVALPGA